MKIALLSFTLFLFNLLPAQLYFPPTTGLEWDSVPPASLGWCQENIDSLVQFAEDKNSFSLIILKDGKIALEEYMNGFNQDSAWYWASAGKSLMSYLVGIAQEEGILNINDPTSNYLGQGWTNTSPSQEAEILIRHQLSMTTGLDYQTLNQNCLADTCLNYLAPPDSIWYYYNAPYRLLQDVVESASGNSLNWYTYTRLGSRIGMGGLWLNYIRWSKSRDLARFGLLALNQGVWDQDTILSDPNYLQAMTQSSNPMNPSYGYLWWLNGQSSYMLPVLTTSFQGPMLPDAPADMYAALGANDQKIYVVPSQGLVVVRQGNQANAFNPALSSFDNQLWEYINNLPCASPVEPVQELEYDLLQEERGSRAWIKGKWDKDAELVLSDLRGRRLQQNRLPAGQSTYEFDIANRPPGIYLVSVRSQGKHWCGKIVKR